MKKNTWKIAESVANWESGWNDSGRFNLRYFYTIFIADKLLAIKEIAEVVEFLTQ